MYSRQKEVRLFKRKAQRFSAGIRSKALFTLLVSNIVSSHKKFTRVNYGYLPKHFSPNGNSRTCETESFTEHRTPSKENHKAGELDFSVRNILKGPFGPFH